MNTELEASGGTLEEGLSRRSFLDRFLIGSGLLFVAGWLTTVLAYLAPAKERGEDGGGPIDAGPLADLPVGQSKVVARDGQNVLVIHTPDGVVALSATCTHLGCVVQFESDTGQIRCPCHAAVFDLRGNVVSGPPPKPLPTFPVTVQDGQILVGGA